MNGALPITVAALIAVGLLLATVPGGTTAAEAEAPMTDPVTLYFEGDGSDRVGVSSGTEVVPLGPESTWNMTPEPPGNQHTTMTSMGWRWSGAYGRPEIPTFLYQDNVSLRNATVTAVIHMERMEDPETRMDATLFDGTGEPLMQVQKWQSSLDPSYEVRETVFVFENVAGSFQGLGFQAVEFGAGRAAVTPTIYHWGSSEYPGRLEIVNHPGPEALPGLPNGTGPGGDPGNVTPASPDDSAPGEEVPGFAAPAALLAVVVGVWVRRRRST